MNLPMGRPGHYRLLPQLDPCGRGELARGHSRTLPCAACDAPPVVVVAPVPVQRPVVPVTPPRPSPQPAPVVVTQPTQPTQPAEAPQGPTVRARIVMALAGLGPGAHDVNELVVAAWRRYPEIFGLRGYEHTYPDSGRVLAKLAGPEGVCGTGHCVRVEGGRIRLTPYGALRARQMEAQHGRG